jgi:hypothetical protein
MARDSGGTYTAPAGNPVASGGVIEATWANGTITDIAAELTNSLDRTGRGAMTAPIKLPDGAKTATAVAFSAESNSGLYRAGAGDVRLAVAGVDALNATDHGITVPGDLAVSGGLAVTGNITGVIAKSTLPAVGQQVSSSSGAFSTNSTAGVDVTNLSVSITTTGRPVVLMLLSAVSTTGYNDGAYLQAAETSALLFLRGATAVGNCRILTTANLPSAPMFVDAPAAGTYTYKVQAKVATGAQSIYVVNFKLVAFEL